MQRLFTYGTLMCEDIMRRVAGDCVILGQSSLPDYHCLRIRDELYPAVVPRTEWVTTGILYDGISAFGFKRLDEFEGDMYRRETVRVTLGAGQVSAFAYVLKSEHEGMLLGEDWRFDRFLAHGKETFIARYFGFKKID